MARIIYSEREVEDILETSRMYGIAPAIRELKSEGRKAPSYPTIVKWFKDRGEEIPAIDSIGQKAVHMKLFYGDNEKKYAAQRLMERIVEKLEEGDLDAKDVNLLSNSLHKAVQTFNLIDGKATNVNETVTKNGDDLVIQDLLSAAKAKNAIRESELIEEA